MYYHVAYNEDIGIIADRHVLEGIVSLKLAGNAGADKEMCKLILKENLPMKEWYICNMLFGSAGQLFNDREKRLLIVGLAKAYPCPIIRKYVFPNSKTCSSF